MKYFLMPTYEISNLYHCYIIFRCWIPISRPCTFPPAHWRLILLIHDFSLVIGGKLHSEYLGFSLLVANYSRNIPFFLHWQPGLQTHLVVKYVHLTRLWIKINCLAGYKKSFRLAQVQDCQYPDHVLSRHPTGG